MNSVSKRSRTYRTAWLFLALAIIAEVTGTSFMADAARGGGYAGYIIMAAALAVSYFFLALSARIISVGVAYAIWEGAGLLLLTIIGITIFNESVSLTEAAGLIAAVIGIVCVALGENH